MNDDDQAGFKTPPRSGRFQPGTSGNPSGRPKGSRNLRSDLTDLMNKTVPVRQNGKPRRIRRQEAMLLRLWEKASQGDVRAANSFINMILKLDPLAGAESAMRKPVSETDEEIIADFLRRNLRSAGDDHDV